MSISLKSKDMEQTWFSHFDPFDPGLWPTDHKTIEVFYSCRPIIPWLLRSLWQTVCQRMNANEVWRRTNGRTDGRTGQNQYMSTWRSHKYNIMYFSDNTIFVTKSWTFFILFIYCSYMSTSVNVPCCWTSSADACSGCSFSVLGSSFFRVASILPSWKLALTT